ncbi:LysR family transcriptional regulator [Adlercreutzia equolifaciens subsp. celatus DSM 18785]|uniref:LysR family transcriptional regulator n=2 Tax=Eggerthellales TaxID=1643822 RepID=A0A3N0AZ85_9ACTN|nr:hypothetical protein DX904_08825 [Adlercreutzia equolifaciens subsp. celatus]RNL40191.1 LysR family transcriptional regulator [Adlercreutzia equolifaciens subsp. celatus DSM 18785]
MRMMKCPEVAERLGISRTSAYEVIRELNQELADKGLITRQGRVSADYFEKRYFGGKDGIQ